MIIIPPFFSENEVYREELRTMEMVKIKQADKLRELELELKALKERIAADEQEDQVRVSDFAYLNCRSKNIPMAQRKRFTRVEMARVLMERNQFKEKLMELQETMKYTEMQRAKKLQSAQNQNRSRIWDLYVISLDHSPSCC